MSIASFAAERGRRRPCRRSTTFAAPFLALLCSVPVVGQTALQGRAFTDERLGLRLLVPNKWKLTSVVPDGMGRAARFQAHREWVLRDGDGYREHRPLLTVWAFPHANAKRELEDSSTDPYRTFDDMLRRRYPLGYEKLPAGTKSVGGTDAEIYRVVLKNDYYERVLRFAVVPNGEVDVAFEFELTDDFEKEFTPLCDDCFGSVKWLETRATGADLETALGFDVLRENKQPWIAERDAWRELPMNERWEVRRAAESALLDRVRAETMSPWKVHDRDSFLVVSSLEKKDWKRVSDAAEAFRSWCDKQFDDLSDEYVRTMVLRVAEDRNSWSYTWGGSVYDRGFERSDRREVSFTKDSYSGTTGLVYGRVFTTTLDLYLQDKQTDVYRFLPRWMEAALFEFVGSAQIKGKKLEFPVEDYEREHMGELTREGKRHTLRELLAFSDEEYLEAYGDDTRLEDEVTAALRYLLGPGRKQKVARKFLTDYFAVVADVVGKQRQGWDDARDTAAILEEERKAREKAAQKRAEAGSDQEKPKVSAKPAKKPDAFDLEMAKLAEKRRLERKLWTKRRQAVSAEVAREFPAWTDREWKALQKGFERFWR